jgi:uncharacterized protein
MLDTATAPKPLTVARRPSPWRWAYAALGVASFGLAVVGAMVPGLPTTIFVLIGSYFLTRSSPRLEERLMRWRIFRPYLDFVRSTEPMSRRARIAAISAMSISVVVSLVSLAAAGVLTWWIGGAIGVLWAIGLVAILRFRRVDQHRAVQP